MTMKRYKNILLWSTLLLSLFQVKTSVYADENQNPIYNPADPSQQIEPLDNVHLIEDSSLIEEVEISEVSEESVEAMAEPEETKTQEVGEEEGALSRTRQERNPLRRERFYLSEDLFDGQAVEAIMNDELSGGGGRHTANFYLDLVSGLVGTAIYGRKS